MWGEVSRIVGYVECPICPNVLTTLVTPENGDTEIQPPARRGGMPGDIGYHSLTYPSGYAIFMVTVSDWPIPRIGLRPEGIYDGILTQTD